MVTVGLTKQLKHRKYQCFIDTPSSTILFFYMAVILFFVFSYNLRLFYFFSVPLDIHNEIRESNKQTPLWAYSIVEKIAIGNCHIQGTLISGG